MTTRTKLILLASMDSADAGEQWKERLEAWLDDQELQEGHHG